MITHLSQRRCTLCSLTLLHITNRNHWREIWGECWHYVWASGIYFGRQFLLKRGCRGTNVHSTETVTLETAPYFNNTPVKFLEPMAAQNAYHRPGFSLYLIFHPFVNILLALCITFTLPYISLIRTSSAAQNSVKASWCGLVYSMYIAPTLNVPGY
jgi:hypothetical protein